MSAPIAPGAGGKPLGSPQEPLPRDIEQMAWTEVRKLQLAIVKDSIELPLNQLDEHTVWKYDTNSSKPTLDSPLRQLRLTTDRGQEKGIKWQSQYDELVSGLPDEVRNLLQIELGKPLNQRSEAYSTLNNLLVFNAKADVWLNAVTQPVDPNSAAGLRGQVYSLLPKGLYEGAMMLTNQIHAQVSELLEDIGPNSPQFDKLQSLLNEMKLLTNYLENSSDSSFERLQAISERLQSLSEQFEASYRAGDLQVLGDLIHHMNQIAILLTGEKGTEPLQFTLGIAALHNNLLLPQEITFLIGSFVSGLHELLPGVEATGKELFTTQLTTTLLSVILLFSAAGKATRALDLPGNERTDHETLALRHFAFRLFVVNALSSNALSSISDKIAELSVSDPKIREVVSTVIMTVGTLLATSIFRTDEESLDSSMIFALRPLLLENLETIKTHLEKHSIASASPLLLFIDRGLAALEKKDDLGFFQAMEEYVQTLGLTQEGQEKAASDLENLAQFFFYAFTEGMDDKTNRETNVLLI